MSATEALAKAWEIIDGSYEDYQEAATSALRLLRAQGFTIVPMKATDTMFMHGGDTPISGTKRHGRIGDLAAADCWRTMIATYLKR